MKSDPGKEVERLIKAEKWSKARRRIMRALEAEPDSHWLWSRLSLTYYEQYRHEEALEASKCALMLAPRCPMVLWDYANDLAMLKREQKAIGILRRLIRRGVQSIAYGPCGEGMRSAKALVTDCYYRIAYCYKALGNLAKAIDYYEKHIQSRTRGIPSAYDLSHVKQMLSQCREAVANQRQAAMEKHSNDATEVKRGHPRTAERKGKRKSRKKGA